MSKKKEKPKTTNDKEQNLKQNKMQSKDKICNKNNENKKKPDNNC